MLVALMVIVSTPAVGLAHDHGEHGGAMHRDVHGTATMAEAVKHDAAISGALAADSVDGVPAGARALLGLVDGPESEAFTTLSEAFVPMAPGSGDWIQAGGELANPYHGSQMLRCGTMLGPLGAKTPGAADHGH